jgi:hypothetical protein
MMSDQNEGFGSGILKGLKRVLFTDSESASNPESGMRNSQSAASGTGNAQSTNPEPGMRNPQSAATGAGSQHTPHLELGMRNPQSESMKLKVYQLLESLNKPGVDFFEVWNAAVEMGGANAANLRAAFTSLKFADKSLSKERLLDTGNGYIASLQQVIRTEAQKRADEKAKLNQEKEQVRSSLSTEIRQIEEQIIALQQKLQAKQVERDQVDAKYDPRIQDIDQKIQSGQVSVNEVLAEMQEVMKIIQRDIN